MRFAASLSRSCNCSRKDSKVPLGQGCPFLRTQALIQVFSPQQEIAHDMDNAHRPTRDTPAVPMGHTRPLETRHSVFAPVFLVVRRLGFVRELFLGRTRRRYSCSSAFWARTSPSAATLKRKRRYSISSFCREDNCTTTSMAKSGGCKCKGGVLQPCCETTKNF